MIVDNISQLEKYISLNKYFPQVIEFIKSHNLMELPPQIYPIVGEKAYINIQLAKGKCKEETVLESHKKMIDIQIPIEGPETYGYKPVSMLPEANYNDKDDISFYDKESPLSYLTCHSDMFVIFFPNDAHAPCISEKEIFKKAVIKIAAE